MISSLMAWALKTLGGRAGVIAMGVGITVAVLLAFSIRAGLATIERQSTQISELRTALATEKTMRQADVAGLTTLIDGLGKVQKQTELDQGALDYAQEVSPPAGLSPYMRAFYDCLRNQRDSGEGCTTVALGAGVPNRAK